MDEVGAFQMPLGVAGGGDAKAALFVQIADQIAGVRKGGLGRHIWVDVAPQGQNVLHAGGLQLPGQSIHILVVGGDAGHVGHGGDVVLVLDQRGDVVGGLVDLGAAGTEGDAES